MFGGNYSPSVADIAAVTNGNCNNGYGGYGFGGDWWAWIIILALFGWGGFGGRQGFGGGFNGCNSCCTPATCAEVQNGFNQQATTSALTGIANGISSLGYDQLNQMNGINTNITTASNGIISALNQNNITAMQNANAVAAQLSDCCCQTREAIQGVNYNMATGFANLGTQINQAAQNIMQNDNANCRAMHDEFVQFQMSQKDNTIAELRSQIQALNLGISQRNQNEYLVGKLQPCPTPAYVVPNPFCCNQQSSCGNCC